MLKLSFPHKKQLKEQSYETAAAKRTTNVARLFIILKASLDKVDISYKLVKRHHTAGSIEPRSLTTPLDLQ